MKKYHDLYLKCDVLLLSNVFWKLRNVNWKNYGLYPSHYLSALVFNCDPLLNMTKIELESILDGDMCLFFQKGKSSSVSYIFKRCSKSNIKYLKSSGKN